MSVKTKRIISRTLVHAVLILVGLFFLLPFFWMLSTALKPDEQLYLSPPVWLPSPLMWDNFSKAANFIPFFSYMGNSFSVAVMDVIGTVIACPLVAYGLSRLEWKGRDLLFFVTIAVMMIPTEVTMIPTFILIKNLGLYNSRWAIILLGCILPWNVIITRTFLAENIHESLVEAAHIDGCNDLQLFGVIVLPLSKAIIAVNVLFYAVGMWNHYFKSMLYLSSTELQPLQIYLRNILFAAEMVADSGGADSSSGLYLLSEKLKYAVIVLGMLPILCIYPFLQKYFVKGVMIGSIKG